MHVNTSVSQPAIESVYVLHDEEGVDLVDVGDAGPR